MYVGADALSLEEFAQVLLHEVGHNYGVLHEDMTGDVRHCRSDVSFCADLTIKKTPIKMKPKVDVRAVRKAHAVKKVRELRRSFEELRRF